MFSALDITLFSLLNEYLRNSFFDIILPFFSFSWPLWVGVICFLFFFSLYCLKHYGDALWRVSALFITFGVTFLVSEFGALLLKDTTQRLRPYEHLSTTLYFSEANYKWFDIIHTENTSSSNQTNTEIAANIVDNSETLASNAPLDDAPLDDASFDEFAENTSDSITDEVIDSSKSIPLDSSQNSPSTEPVNKVSVQKLEDFDLGLEISKQNFLYPQIEYTDAVEQSVFSETGSSMPSSFAANVMALTFIIALLFPKSTPWVYLIPLLTGWARVYTGNSYPLDIIMGWIWGILAVAIAWFICEYSFRFASKYRKL